MSFLKKLPPYGKILKDHIYYGYQSTNVITIVCGLQAWKKYVDVQSEKLDPVLVLPPYENPTHYIWPVKDSYVVLIDSDDAAELYVKNIINELFKSGALMVVYSGIEGLIIFKRN